MERKHGDKVELNSYQLELRKKVEDNLAIAKQWNRNLPEETLNKAFEEMRSASHELHMQLSPRPKHHRYMIENRMLKPEDPQFYDHIHPVEDLLKYLDDTSANDDPEDVTLGKRFEFKVYTSRWGHYDNYSITRNEEGWYVHVLSYSGQDNIYGDKVLKSAMEHDSVSYPRNYGSFLSSIWTLAQDEGLSYESVQSMLNELAEWISQTEKNAPRHFLI